MNEARKAEFRKQKKMSPLDHHVRWCVEKCSVGPRRLMAMVEVIATLRKHNRHKGCIHISTAVLQDLFGKRYAEVIDPIAPPVFNEYFPGQSMGRQLNWTKQQVLKAIKKEADRKGWYWVSDYISVILDKNHHLSTTLHSYTCPSKRADLPLFVPLKLDGRMSLAGRATILGIMRRGGESYRPDPKGGRRYSVGPGMMYATGKTRKMALKGSGLVDLDMRRAFPTIFLHLLEAHGMQRQEFPFLCQYVDSRDLTRKEKDDANACMNGRANPHTLLGRGIMLETTVAREALRQLGFVVEGRDWLHRLLAPVEDKILSTIVSGLSLLSLRPLSLIFDGLICEDPGPQGIEFLEGHVEAQFPGLGMRLVTKEKF